MIHAYECGRADDHGLPSRLAGRWTARLRPLAPLLYGLQLEN
jgi:hypothetical protein